MNHEGNLSNLKTSDLVNQLAGKDKGNDSGGLTDVRKLIQQKTIQAQQLKNKNPSVISSMNFNQASPKRIITPRAQPVQSSTPSPTPSKRIQLNLSSPPKLLSSKQLDNQSNNSFFPTSAQTKPQIRAHVEEDDDTQSNAPLGNGQIILDADSKVAKRPHHEIKQAIDVKIPPNLDFGLDLIVNKKVLSAISDEEDDDEDNANPAQRLYQGSPKRRLHTPSPQASVGSGRHGGKLRPKLDLKSKVKPKFQASPSPVASQVFDEDEDLDEDEDEDEDENENVGEGGDIDDDDNEDEDEDGDDDEGGGGGGDEDGDEDGDDGEHKDDGIDDDDDINTDGLMLNGGNPSVDDADDDEADSNKEDESEIEPDSPIIKKRAHKMSREELLIAKRRELTKIERLIAKGYKPAKRYGMADGYDEMRAERKRLEDEKGCADAIKWQRKMLVGTSTGIEYLNKTYQPFDIELNGWSESVYENIDDYDEVFEELYHKYKNKVKVAPELKLLGMFAGSALMFHFSKTLFSKASDKVPGFEDVMQENPELKQAYEQAALRKMNMNGDQANNKMSGMIGNFLGNPMLGNMLGGLMGGGPSQGPPMSQRPVGPPISQNSHNMPMSQRPPVQPMSQRPPAQPMSQRPPAQPMSQRPPAQLMSQRPPAQPMSQRPPAQPMSQRPPAQPSNTTTTIRLNPGQSKKSPETKISIEMDGPNGVDDLLNSLTQSNDETQLSGMDTDSQISDLDHIKNQRTTKKNNPRKRLNLN